MPFLNIQTSSVSEKKGSQMAIKLYEIQGRNSKLFSVIDQS